MKILVIQPRADLDIDEQVEYLARSSPKTAMRFLDGIQAALTRLLDFPEIGSPCEFTNLECAGTRMWPIPGFPRHLVFYTPTEDHLLVVRVLHAARDLAAIFSSK